ncbi:TRAP transporter small permease subunit [Amorphus sp. 3PC139-8]|uniref:TRAP transporter small permease subunit n=1 Tax=Amorphus sp. 3PC139-8 TaxID=2735676 RepID=UPI00345DFE29
MNDALYGIANAIDRITVPVGRVSALVLPILMLVIILNVVLRYGFGLGLVELEELQWHLNALVVLGCLAYAYRDDVHVRVDLFHAEFSPLRKAVVELFGGLFLLMPFVIGIAWFAWGTFAYSFSIGEGSPMPSGLPARYVIKFCMFAGFVLLGLQGIAQICRALLTLRGAASSYPPVSR